MPLKKSFAQACEPEQNRILRALCPRDRAKIFPHLSMIDLKQGEVLYESTSTQRYAYFPLDSIASMLYIMEDGHTCEIAQVGRTGMVGISIFTEAYTTTHSAVVLGAGRAWRLRAGVFREELDRSQELRSLLLRYTQVLVTQLGQAAACNRYHTIHQQLCRWLLMAMVNRPDGRLMITQEQIANSLGVRREGVTEAAGKLQRAGLIECRRGQIKILDRDGLEQTCCECFDVVSRETDRLLPR